MKILMISDVFFPRVNGVSTSIMTFTESLLSMGHQVTLIAPQYSQSSPVDFEVIRINSRPVPFDPEDRLMSLSMIKKMTESLRQLQFDIIHIQTPFVAHYAGVYLAKKLNIPVVVSYHTFFEAYFEKYLTFLPSGLLRSIARRFSAAQCNDVDGIISPSRQMLEKLREYGAKKRAQIIPTGLKLDDYQFKGRSNFRANYGIRDDESLLLYVGRVAHEKNIPFLIDVFQEVSDHKDNIKLVIAGEGPALKSLQNRVKAQSLEDQVIFVGYLDRQTELLDCYQSSDIFVFASETETQGLVLLEAMACHLPVVSLASMGTRSVLQEGKGCLIAQPEVNDFADKVCKILLNDELAAQLAESAGEYVKHWAADAKARELVSFYQSVSHSMNRQPDNAVNMQEQS